MKILIMVLSFRDHPYGELMQSQKETWASMPNTDCKSIFYTGSKSIYNSDADSSHSTFEWLDISFDITDEYYYMSGKLKLALESIKNTDYNFIWRTNSSSYINKERLLKFAESLPKEKCYAGAEIKTNEGFSIVSGAGFFISPDVAEILREEIDPEFEKEEDYYVGMILNKHGIEVINDSSRIDVPEVIPDDIDLTSYHYRLKCGLDRIVDVQNMYKIHKLINA